MFEQHKSTVEAEAVFDNQRSSYEETQQNIGGFNDFDHLY